MAQERKVSPDDVIKLGKPAPGFLCPITANSYGIEFLSFRIRTIPDNKVVFQIERDSAVADVPEQYPADFDFDALRTIKYTFPASLLKAKSVGTRLVFKVGDNAVKDFRMIERHFLKDKLIKSYDFTFPFCLPNSTNEYEAVYDLPALPDGDIQDMVRNPYLAQSDSFYFVEGKLVMHNKAFYKYDPAQ